MRDPKRIGPLLALIELIWRANPDLRLTQLIGNVAPGTDPYYLEDDMLTDRLVAIYNPSD